MGAMTIPPPPIPVTPPEPAAPAALARRSWWRSNLLALVALVVLVPATALGIGGYEWHQFYGFGARPYVPVQVEATHTAKLAGATWGPIRSVEVKDLSGLDVPSGTRLIAAAIPVDAGSTGVTCARPTLTHQESGREWNLVRSEIGVETNLDEPEFCSPADTGKYELIAPFLIPDDVEGPFWVDVWPQDAGGSFLRFEIDP